MTISPKKIWRYKSTVNRGVEAKSLAVEAPADLDCSTGSGDAAAAGGELSPGDEPASYVQVVVQKHRRPAARLPVASSPRRRADTEPTAVTRSMYPVTYDAPVAPVCAGCGGTGEGPLPPGDGDETTAIRQVEATSLADKGKNIFWNKISTSENRYGPERIEIYYFEKQTEFLWAHDGAGDTSVERAVRAVSSPIARIFDELLAIPRLLLQIPVYILLRIERCAFVFVRAAVTDAVQTMSDQLLKPSLTIAFNALVRPPLVCVAHVAGAARDAARPLWLVLGDALEPLNRLLAQIRLVHYERRCLCTQCV